MTIFPGRNDLVTEGLVGSLVWFWRICLCISLGLHSCLKFPPDWNGEGNLWQLSHRSFAFKMMLSQLALNPCQWS